MIWKICDGQVIGSSTEGDQHFENERLDEEGDILSKFDDSDLKRHINWKRTSTIDKLNLQKGQSSKRFRITLDQIPE